MTVGETAEAIIQHYIGGNDYIFTSSDPDVLEVSGSGLSATLTAKKAGSVILTATCGAQVLTQDITVIGETTTTTATESTTTTTEEITTTTEEVTTTTEESTTTTTSSSETTTESTTTESTTTSTTNGGSVDPTLFYGDVNLDGDIDLADAVLLNKAVAGVVSLNELANKNADCNGNGTVTADDSMMLLQFLVHLINQLGPEA